MVTDRVGTIMGTQKDGGGAVHPDAKVNTNCI
jgi:hypothetical protein